MNVSQDLSIIELMLNASLVVKLVMLLLIVVSLMSWYWIFRKGFAIRDARTRTDQFERDFWSGGDLNAMYQSAVNNRHETGALERIFEAGYREFTKLRGQPGMDTKAVVDGARRAMRACYQRELDDLDAHLSFLASVGSVSPYVGLLGPRRRRERCPMPWRCCRRCMVGGCCSIWDCWPRAAGFSPCRSMPSSRRVRPRANDRA